MVFHFKPRTTEAQGSSHKSKKSEMFGTNVADNYALSATKNKPKYNFMFHK